MAKKDTKTVYVCAECGEDFVKWVGKCPACGAWNTFKEYSVPSESVSASLPAGSLEPSSPGTSQPINLSKIKGEEVARIDMYDQEFNRVLGGGMVPGSLVLIGGEPGIGKSTLVLQSILRNDTLSTLYVSGEESPAQIKLRADRLSEIAEESHVSLYSETDLDVVLRVAREYSPGLLVIDSIQTMYTSSSDSSPGSLSQVRECTHRLLQFAKKTAIPVLIIGHITKEGSLAGPKVMEHLVDAVLLFEGDPNHQYRILRSLKNRFGNTSEIGIYEMRHEGLREVSNPSELLLSNSEQNLSGICVAVTIEGQRPILVEVQALVSSAVFGTPQRSSTGMDIRRMNMLLAVLEKRAGFKLIQKDVFLNIAGGLRTTDPAVDLALISAVLSSHLDLAISSDMCVAGEVGLSGEVRAIARIEQRISEAAKIGFKRILVPGDNLKGLDLSRYAIRVLPVSRVEEAFRILFRSSSQAP